MRRLSHFLSHPKADLWCIGAIWLLFLALTPFFGIWEPWESNFAQVVEQMRSHGNWLQVQMPVASGSPQAIPNLSFAYWPAVGSTALFGYNAFGLRLPGLLFALPAMLLLYSAARRFFGRIAAVCSMLVLLGLPLFVYPVRIAFAQSVSLSALTISCLSVILLFAEPKAQKRFQWLAFGGFVVSSLCSGLTGFLTPLATAIVALLVRRHHTQESLRDLFRRFGLWPAVVAFLLIALGVWRACVHNLNHLGALFLWQDSLTGTLAAKNRPSFELAAHQLGFGLFPFSALLPFAFARLLSNNDPAEATTDDQASDDDPKPCIQLFAPAIFTWLALAFLIPACFISYCHTTFFIGAPAAALAVGLYIASILKNHSETGLREPIWALCTVAALALIDSNLKHDPHLLADVLVGSRVEEFPGALPGFFIVRLLDMLLLAALLLYQAGADRALRPVFTWLFYPIKQLAIGYRCFMAVISLLLPIYITVRPPRFIENLLQKDFWSGLLPPARKSILFVVIWVVSMIILQIVWSWRVKKLDGRREGQISEKLGRMLQTIMTPRFATVSLLAIAALIAFFQNSWITQQMTKQFSQRDIVEAYQRFAQKGEKLYKYSTLKDIGMYYTRDYPDIDPVQFKLLAQQPERFFALIPRSQLAQMHTEFKRVTERNLPVLHNENFRVILISNQLKPNEQDLNPINHALVNALPPKAQASHVVFDHKIELAGWKVTPAAPRPGTQAVVSLFWRVLEPVSGQWKVFIHLDAAGQRINGDHDPVEGLFPTSNWAKGDLIQDDHHLLINHSVSPDLFTLYAGLFQGSKRMPITEGSNDNDNRAKLGTVRVH